MQRQTIMISGARAPVALELARSFHKQGHRVIMLDAQRFTISRWSNAVDIYYTIPSPRYDRDGFVSKLSEIVLKENVDHFIPTCEEAIYVSACKKKLTCEVWTVDLDLMLKLHNKYRFAIEFSHLLPIPNTILLKDFQDWKASKSYVFKPVYSRFATAVLIGKKLSSTNFEQEDKTKWLAQTFIEGKEICVYSIWANGRLKAYSAYHPLYRAGKGAGVFFEPVHYPNVYEDVVRFGSEIRYHGQLCFDVIIDQAHKHYFIECNPRATSGAHLLNENITKAFLDNEGVIIQNQKEYAIKYAMAILHPFSLLKKRVMRADDVIFKWNDILPFLLQFTALLELLYIKLSKKIGWLEASTVDIEWNED